MRIAPPPAWLIERLTTRSAGTPASGSDAPPEPLPSDVWSRLTGQPVTEYRDMAAARIVGHLSRHACDYQLVLGLMHAWNSAWCKPPLGYHELTRIVDRIANKQAQEWERAQ